MYQDHVRPGIDLGTKVGYLGREKYTFTRLAGEDVLRRYHPHIRKPGNKLVGFSSIFDGMQALAEEKIDSLVSPRENIGGGKVAQFFDASYEFSGPNGVVIVDSYNRPINMCVGGKCKPSHVGKVVSKNEALSQCSKKLARDFRHASRQGVDSTSEAVRLVARRKYGYKNAVALGSEEAFDHYGVGIWEKDYQNRDPNITRFAVMQKVKRKKGRRKGRTVATGKSRRYINDVTSIAVTPTVSNENLIGDLAKLAYDSGVVMKGFYNRPTGSGTDIVFLDLLGHRNDENIRRYCGRLQKGFFKKTTRHVDLGSYPFYDFFRSNIDRVGVIGDQKSINQMLLRFLKKCGYETFESNLTGQDCVKHSQFLTWKSDVVIANRPGRRELVRLISYIDDDLNEDKLLVVNTSDPQRVRDALKFRQPRCNVLFMDAPVVSKLRLEGQNVIFTGDNIEYPPDSKESAFMANYYKAKANVTTVDFFGHSKTRGYSKYAPTLFSFGLLRLGQLSGIDFRELAEFQNPTERVYFNSAQKTAASGVSARAFSRYAREHSREIDQICEEMSSLAHLPPEQSEQLLREAVGASNDIDNAIKSTTALHGIAMATDLQTDPDDAILRIRELCNSVESYHAIM